MCEVWYSNLGPRPSPGSLITGVDGSLDHETDDANSFAEWGVDMLKYDSCYHMGRIGTPQISFNRFKVMADALKSTGRNILFNLCNWGEDQVHTVSRDHEPCTEYLQLITYVVGNVYCQFLADHWRHLRLVYPPR